MPQEEGGTHEFFAWERAAGQGKICKISSTTESMFVIFDSETPL